MGKTPARRKSILSGLAKKHFVSKRGSESRRWRFQIFFFLIALLFFATAALSQDLSVLSQTLRSGNTEEKRDALMTLRSMQSEDSSRVAVIALNDKTPIVRATAASSVVFLPGPEAVAALSPLLNDKDEFVRREGAFALGTVGDAAAAPLLIRSMRSDKSLEVRSAAAAAVGKTGNPDAVSPLAAVFSQSPSEDNELLRRSAARSIGQIAQIMRSGKTRVITPQDFLPEKYKDIDAQPSPELSSHFKSAVGLLIRVLENSSEADDTRREAAFALGAIGDRSAESVLTKYTSSSDVYLAEISKEALLKLRAVE